MIRSYEHVVYIFLIVSLFFSACGTSDFYADESSYQTYETHCPIVSEDHTLNDQIISTERYSEVIQTNLTLSDALARAYLRRENITQPSESAIAEIIRNRRPVDIDWLSFTEGINPPGRVSSAELAYDAEVFFDLLRYLYGPYNYFGGDTVFDPILENIHEILNAQEYWTASAFSHILHSNLSNIIFDNHFNIDGAPFAIRASFFVGDMIFDKSENGFRTRDTNRYVAEVIGHDVHDVFRLAMDNDGEFFFAPIVTSFDTSNIEYSLSILLDDGDKKVLNLHRQNTTYMEYEEPSLKYEGDIPIVTLRRMGHLNTSPVCGGLILDEESIHFLSLADYLQDEDIIIVDIRSNFGGYGLLPHIWLFLITGEIVPNNFVSISPSIPDRDILIPAEPCYCQDNRPVYFEYLSIYIRDEKEQFLGEHHIISALPDSIVPNEKLIIMLVDGYTFSAGETFADLMLNMENTLIIGQNTFGGLISSSQRFYLPYSNIPVNMGPFHNVFDEGGFMEGVGIAPDIWVNGDALEAALSMLGKWK